MSSSLAPLATDYGLPPPDLAAARLSATHSPDSRFDPHALTHRLHLLASRAVSLRTADAEALLVCIDAIEEAVAEAEALFLPVGAQ